MPRRRKIDWGSELFPEFDAEDWELYSQSSDESGNADIVQARVRPELARAIDELVMEAKMAGLPFNTRSDYVRFAVTHALKAVMTRIQASEDTSHAVFIHAQLTKRALRDRRLKEIENNVKDFLIGLQFVLHPKRKDYHEARSMLTSFLVPILQFDSPYLQKAYIQEVFGHPEFRGAYELIKEKVGENEIMMRAKEIYIQMKRGPAES